MKNHPSLLAKSLPWAILLILAVLPLLAPLFGLEYYVGFVRRMLIIMLAAMSLNFLIGQGGMVALGHAGFVGVGAYLLVAMADAGVTSAWLMWGVALIGSGLIAAAIGAVSLRTKGVYFIMITLAFAQMLYYLAVSISRFGGDDGYTLMMTPELGLGLGAAQGNILYWTVLVIGALAFALFTRVVNSRFGKAMAGVRDNEVRMEALGYPVYALKLCAFAAAGALAGLSGALLVTQSAFASPSMMHWSQSATMIVMIVVGGIGQRWGAVLGVALWMGLEELFRQMTEYSHWPLGLLLILVVFHAPHGLSTLLALRPAAKARATELPTAAASLKGTMP